MRLAWGLSKVWPTGRQRHRPFAHGRRSKRKTLGVIDGEAVPSLSRVALLVDFSTPNKERTIKLHQTAAQALGISLWPVEILAPDDVEPVFAKIAEDRADGIVRGPGSALFNWRARVGASALKHRLPVMSY